MSELTYDNAKKYFHTTWMSGLDEYWYRKAWECLAQKGLTKNDTYEEYCIVVIRALVLSIIYDLYCKQEADEYYEFDNLTDLLEGDITEFELGQLYAKHTDGEFMIDDDYIGDTVLLRLCETQRAAVVSALKETLGDNKMFYGMYYTDNVPSDWHSDHWDEEYDEDDEYDTYNCSYEEYWKYVESGDEIFTHTELEIFDWIQSNLEYSFY